jgi:hypothetical protein
MNKKCITIALLLAALSIIGCNDGDLVKMNDVTEDKAIDVRVLIAKELKVGSPFIEIEGFFQRHKIIYSYDRFSKRYQGIIRNVGNNKNIDQAVTIYIYVDEEKSFTSSDVDNSFTAP